MAEDYYKIFKKTQSNRGSVENVNESITPSSSPAKNSNQNPSLSPVKSQNGSFHDDTFANLLEEALSDHDLLSDDIFQTKGHGFDLDLENFEENNMEGGKMKGGGIAER